MEITAAVVSQSGGAFELEQLELAAPREDEVLVRIVGVGLCHTDMICRDQLYPVPLPAVLGHEGSGVVEAVGGAVTDLVPGDHVVLSFHACGDCKNCVRGLPSRCANLFDSNFAGKAVAPVLSQEGRAIGHFCPVLLCDLCPRQ